MLGKNVIGTTYGINIQSPQDEVTPYSYFLRLLLTMYIVCLSQLVLLSGKTHHALHNAVIPGMFLVDIFPSCKLYRSLPRYADPQAQ